MDGIEESGDMEVQAPEEASWVTSKRWCKGKSTREASPELPHLKKYAWLCNVGDISSGAAWLEQDDSPSCQGHNSCNKDGARFQSRVDRYWW